MLDIANHAVSTYKHSHDTTQQSRPQLEKQLKHAGTLTDRKGRFVGWRLSGGLATAFPGPCHCHAGAPDHNLQYNMHYEVHVYCFGFSLWGKSRHDLAPLRHAEQAVSLDTPGSCRPWSVDCRVDLHEWTTNEQCALKAQRDTYAWCMKMHF